MIKRQKPWERSEGIRKRTQRVRGLQEKILIICEGKCTEPNYFKAFPVNTEIVELEIQGDGLNTESLVQAAIEEQKFAKKEKNPYNQIWCVFDKDSFSKKQIKSALQLAQKNKIEVAYSNEAFELWYMLHFNYYDVDLSRKDYGKKLSSLLKEGCKIKGKYEKNSLEIYRLLKSRQEKAIKHARRLLQSYGGNYCPYESSPSTTVHKLVKVLNDYI